MAQDTTGATRTQDTTGTLKTFDLYATSTGREQQAVAIGNGSEDGLVAGLLPWGSQDVMAGPATLLYDSWSAGLDTTDKWAVTGNAPTISGGTNTMSATVSSYNALRGITAIRPNAGYTYVANGITLEASAATGAGRFWGLGTVATTPSATSLVQDGIGFEVDQATGALYAVTYVAGVRTIVATLPPGGAPTGTGANTSATVANVRDGAAHRFALYFRVTGAYWFIDNMAVRVASSAFPNVAVAELPPILVRYNAAAYTGTPVFASTAHITGDTSRQGVSIIDPVVGSRAARVDANGAQTMRPTPAATGTITSVTAAAASTLLLAANANRLGATFTNDSTATLYLALASAASTTAHTVQVAGGGYYELPASGYVGPVYGIWSAANGAVRVTELTP